MINSMGVTCRNRDEVAYLEQYCRSENIPGVRIFDYLKTITPVVIFTKNGISWTDTDRACHKESFGDFMEIYNM